MIPFSPFKPSRNIYGSIKYENPSKTDIITTYRYNIWTWQHTQTHFDSTVGSWFTTAIGCSFLLDFYDNCWYSKFQKKFRTGCFSYRKYIYIVYREDSRYASLKPKSRRCGGPAWTIILIIIIKVIVLGSIWPQSPINGSAHLC